VARVIGGLPPDANSVARFSSPCRTRSLRVRLVRKLPPDRSVAEQADSPASWRRLPVGAEVAPAGGVHFRVWAPRATRVDVQIADRQFALDTERGGYHAGLVPSAAPGTRYTYRLDGGPVYPDPASRFQPTGPHGPSEVIDPAAFAWSDYRWPGITRAGQVLYELHVGTFTAIGTWEAASRELPQLARAGVTVVEVMPVADFVGDFGWGYDGVNLFAPTRLYGRPDDFRAFVDQAHAIGLGVILDVVYNHLGPDGNYLGQFAPDYFSDRHRTDWGPAINFDGENSEPVREFFVANAGYWIDEFHLDGLRLDATQDIHDDSPEHFLAAMGRRARDRAGRRSVLLVAENDRQDVSLIQPVAAGGYGLDAVWSDDFHHSASVAMTGRAEAYFRAHAGTPQELISAVKRGYLYQGQPHAWWGTPRGTPARDVAPAAFVHYTQNHDQVANSLAGLRGHRLTSPGRYRAMTALLLLGPATPLLFQGQEFAASSPFLYFADLPPGLAKLVRAGRAELMARFPSLAGAEAQAALPDPADRLTFERSKLDLTERERHTADYALHVDLLRLRRDDSVFRAQGTGGVDGAVLGAEALAFRFFGAGAVADDRLLCLNLGRDLTLTALAEPLLAPPAGSRWSLLWSSEAPGYGGGGTPALDLERDWVLPGHAALVFRSSQ
jgi:maltooligosyltrehalose trehalohydrolase